MLNRLWHWFIGRPASRPYRQAPPLKNPRYLGVHILETTGGAK